MGPWAETAFHAYDTLRAEVPLTSFRAEEAAITVTLAHEGDLDRARSLNGAALGSTQTEVFFQSDLVTLFPGARGDQARNLLANMDADTRARLVSVWTDDRSATLTTDSNAHVEELARTISQNQDATALESVTLAVGQGDALTFSLQVAPGDLEALTRIAMTLASEDHVTRLRVQPGFTFDLDLDSAPSDGDLADYAATLKSLSTFGERLCLDWATSSFCVETAPTIDPDSIRGNGAQAGQAFIEAWNAAE